MRRSTWIPRPRKGHRRTITLFLLVVAVPFCAIFVLVHTPWGRARMRDAAIEAIRSELGLQATMRHVEVELIPSPRVSARGIALDDPVYGRFAEADGLTIRPSIGALLTGTVDLRSIEIDAPVLNLILRDGEIRNLPEVRGSTEGGGEDLPFSELNIRGARVTLDAEPLGSGFLEGVNIEMDTVNGNELDIAISVVSGRFDHIHGTERLQRLRVAGHVSPSAIDVDQLMLWTPHLKVRARNAHLGLPFGHDYSGYAEVRVNLSHLQNLPHGWDLPELHGLLQVEGDITGAEAGPTAQAVILIEDGRIEEFGLGDSVELVVELDPEEARIVEGAAYIIEGGGRVDLQGSVGLGEGVPLDMRVGINDLSFSRLMEQLGVTPNTIVQWAVNGNAHLQGTIDPLEFDGPITLETEDFLVTQDAWHAQPNERVVGVTRARISGGVSVLPDGLRFERLIADTPRSRLYGDVLIGFDNKLGVSVRSDIDLRDASPLLEFPIGGNGQVRVEVDGTFDEPVVRGDVTMGEFAFDTFVLGNIESDWQLEKDGLAIRFPQVAAVKRQSRYRVDDLFLDFTEDRFSIEGSIYTPRFSLADFYHVFHYEDDERFIDYQGIAEGTSKVRFTLGHPGDSPTGTMTADMDLALADMSINDFLFSEGHFRGRWRWLHQERGVDGGELEIDHLHLRKGDGVVHASGRMDLGSVLHVTGAADRISVRDTEGLTDRLPDLGGVYGVTVNLGGTLDVPHADMDVSVTGLSWQNAMIGDARAYVRLTDREDPWVRAADAWDPGNLPNDEPCAASRSGLWRGRWNPDPPLRTIEGPKARLIRPMAFLVCAEGLGGQVEVDMAIGRTEVFPLRGVVELRDLALAPFLRQYEVGEPITGTVSGRAQLDGGAMLEDSSLVGRVQLTELEVGQAGVELRNEGEVDLRMSRGDFDVARAVFVGPSSRVNISGGGSSRSGLALAVDGELDLGVVATLSPRFTHAGGRFDVHVNVSGMVDSPAVFGQALVREASFRYAGFPAPIHDLGGEITFSARRVLFEDFTARMAGGRLSLTGAATLRGRGIDRYEFDIEASDLSLTPQTGVEVALGGRARLDWAREQRLPLLHGTLRIGRLGYTRPIELAQNLSLSALSRRQRAEVERYDPEDDRVELDLRVVDDAPMRIANNIIDAQVRIEDTERPFRIVGTDQRFGATGTLLIPRGVVYFRNTEFDIRRGVIDFDDTYRVDPNFDLMAVTDVRRSEGLTGPNWRIILQANGNSDAFQLNTSSEPELSQEDIMLLLTVGMTRAEAEQLQAGDITSTVALEALATVTGIDREVQRAVPVIDDFQITSRYSPRTNRTEPQVTIGKRIADRVRLTASTGISESRELRTSVEWRLSDQTSIEAVYDNINTTTASAFGNIGLDVRWRLEFE